MDKINEKFGFQVTLKCYSPIIHFQHDKPGATLRATEVKPKLDRFLNNKAEKINFDIPKEWYVKNDDTDKKAFDYKMRIEACDDNKSIEPHELYYGNMGKRHWERIRAIEGNCEVTIICFIPELLKLIQDNLTEFFAVTNFGTMQGKGFGSFLPEDAKLSDSQIAEWLCQNSGSENCYKISGNKFERNLYEDGTKSQKINGNWTDVPWSAVDFMFDDIKMLYSVMKSGYNINGQYKRSYLFQYFHLSENGNIGNEKAYMKKMKVSPAISDPSKDRPISEHEYDYSEFRYVRALLGLGEKIDYIEELEPKRDNQGNYVYKKGKLVYEGKKGDDGKVIKQTVTISHNATEAQKKEKANIERLPSPIFFKIIDKTIYIVANRIDDKIHNIDFVFTNMTTNEKVIITSPEKNQFNIDKFLSWFVDEYNKEYLANTRLQEKEKNKYALSRKIEKIEKKEVKK